MESVSSTSSWQCCTSHTPAAGSAPHHTHQQLGVLSLLTERSLRSAMTVLTASSTASALTRSTRARQVQVAIMQSRDTLEARKEETGHGEGEGRGEGGGEEYMREICYVSDIACRSWDSELGPSHPPNLDPSWG